jgi:hypothetical protein
VATLDKETQDLATRWLSAGSGPVAAVQPDLQAALVRQDAALNSVNIPLKTAAYRQTSLKFGRFSQLSRAVRAPWSRQRVYHAAPFVNNCKEYVMLQAREIQQRFTHIQQTISDAEKACRSGDAPDELRDCIEKMSRESQQAQQVMQSNDQQRMVECVDSLESMGDEAKRISRSAPTMSPQVESAVTKVHAELSNLKHQIH